MSKIIIRNTIFLGLLLIGALFYAGCSKATEEACEQCKPLSPDKQLPVKLGTIEKTFNLWKNDGRNNKNNYCILANNATASTNELAATLKALNLYEPANIPGPIVGIAYYVSKDLAKEDGYQINSNDIKGVVVYYLKEGHLNTRVLIDGAGKLEIIGDLSAEVDWISFNDLETLSQHFFNNGNNAISMMLITDFDKTQSIKGRKNHFSRKVEQYIGHVSAGRPTGIGHYEQHGGDNCGNPCPRKGKLRCGTRGGTPTCDDLATDCAKKNLSAWNTSAEEDDPRNPILYKFKDEFMAQSAMGQHFIQDFYYIGGFLKDNLNANIAAESFAMMDHTIIPIVNKLLNDPQSTAVIYDQTTKSQLIGYIDHVRILCNDPVFLEIIDEIKVNIEFFAGKTVKETYAETMAS